MNSKEIDNKEETSDDLEALLDSMCEEPTAEEQAAFRRSLGKPGDTIVGMDEEDKMEYETL
jgi:hypothetical protein